MSNLCAGKWRNWAAGLILALLAIAAVTSFLPLIETDRWWIRYLDFPRLQLAITLVLLLAAAAALRSHLGRIGWVVCGLGVLALGYQAEKLYPFTRIAAPAAAGLESCAPGGSLKLMIANVQARNEQAEAFLDLVSEADPDLLLVMETDAWWDRKLAALRDSFPERAQFIPDGHGAFGMHVLSKLPLVSPEFRFLFGAYTPTAVAGVELPDGGVVQLIGVHPHPPLAWSQPTTLRDGSLLMAGRMARSSPEPTIVAGDFNAVPWEPVTRRAARIGGLLDPRLGRGLHPSFSADSALISWPLDQILFQDGLGVVDFEVLHRIGSDHYPVMARLCHAPERGLRQNAPEPAPGDIEQAETSIDAARALAPEGRS